MNNDNNPFKSIEDKFKEMQGGKQKKTASADKVITPKKPFNTRKFVKTAITLTVIFAVAVILLANVFVVKEGEYKVVSQFGEIKRIEHEPGEYKNPIHTIRIKLAEKSDEA